MAEDNKNEQGEVEETTPRIQASLERFLGELIGETPRVSHRCAGIFGLTQDLLPLVGRDNHLLGVEL